jgi:flagellar basal-body rod modification protein FlgD
MAIGMTGQLSLQMTPAQKAAVDQQVDFANKANPALHGRKAGQNLGKDDFLKLLLTQLSHQDPLSPMDNTQFIAQMAQFSTLEQMTNISQGFDKLNTTLGANNAVGMLGKKVDVAVGGSVVSGSVTGLRYGDVPQVVVNGASYNLAQVKAVYEQ